MDIVHKVEKISQVASWGGGLLLLLTAVLIAVEIVLRKVFSISLGGTDELSRYALAVSCSWGFSFALFRKSHIRIDILYRLCPQRLQQYLDIFSMSMFLIYLGVVSWFACFVLKTSLVRHSTANTPLATPLWIPQSLWLAGLIWFCIVILVLLTVTFWRQIKGTRGESEDFASIVTLEEEIEEIEEVGDKS
jgi:TRAP-type C4-dicarboxylate transport system permease small subunit